jgi:diguanylate cyclase (GGDEF)-like protein/excisionase family DNA binding protein
MTERLLFEIPADLRLRVASVIREHEQPLAEDIVVTLGPAGALDAGGARALASVLVGAFASVLEEAGLDTRRAVGHDISPPTETLSAEQVIHSIHRVERVLLDELALDQEIGATSERWPQVTHAVRSAAFDIVLAYSERNGARAAVRDRLTTLIAPPVFRLALEQEMARAYRYGHAMSMLLFDIDNLDEVNASQGYGAGDRLLERLGILARQFFRSYDWVARYRGGAIAAVLPETELDQAARIAGRFRKMVEGRLLLMDHNTEAVIRVTVSAAAVGTDFVHAEVDAGYVVAEADAAVLRAKLDGGNRLERVALIPSSVTIFGAATLLGVPPKHVVQLMRNDVLPAARRGRHFHIECADIEDYKRSRERQV